jgi:hypothetical protein
VKQCAVAQMALVKLGDDYQRITLELGSARPKSQFQGKSRRPINSELASINNAFASTMLE